MEQDKRKPTGPDRDRVDEAVEDALKSGRNPPKGGSSGVASGLHGGGTRPGGGAPRNAGSLGENGGDTSRG